MSRIARAAFVNGVVGRTPTSYVAELRGPAKSSHLIGRDLDLNRLRAKLARGARLITLFGPAGIGKTALAREVVRLELRRRVRGGAGAGAGAGGWRRERRVVFVDLAEARDEADVLRMVGLALNVLPFDPRRDPLDHLALVLEAQDGPSIVVLDACDRVVDAVAELVRRLITTMMGSSLFATPIVEDASTTSTSTTIDEDGGCENDNDSNDLRRAGSVSVDGGFDVDVGERDHVVFIVTSRELLGLTEEHAYEVGPLSVPAVGEHSSDAVSLFLLRASQVRKERLRSVDPAVIADIVRSLEGIPLALELAAGRMSVLSASELRARLSSRLGVLTSQLRTEHPRQRTMRAAIEWSWTQLEPHEQTALRQLSVFCGGFDVVAAEAVIDLRSARHRDRDRDRDRDCDRDPEHAPQDRNDGQGEAEALRVIDVLQSLRAKSFIRGDEMGGEVRLGLYEIIRELGAQTLGTEEKQETIRRHADYFVKESASWGAAIGSTYEVIAIAKLNENIDNLLAVHARALEGATRGGVEDAFRVLVHLEPVMWTSLPAHMSLALLDAALGCVDVDAGAGSGDDIPISISTTLRCEILLRRSRALELMGQQAKALQSAEEALSLAHTDGNVRLEASALARLGSIDLTRGDAVRASNRLRQALLILPPELDPRLAANAFSALGTALRMMSDVEGARMAHEDALAIRARLGDARGAGVDFSCLAALHFQQGQLEQARLLIDEALACSIQFDDRYAHAYAIGMLGSVLAELGELEQAHTRYEEALLELERLGDRRLHAIFSGYAAVARQLAGEMALADAGYRASLRVLAEQGDRLHEGLFAGAASTLAWAHDESDRAESLYALARDRLTELSPSFNARLTSALSLFLGHRDLWLHRCALGTGDDRTAKTHAASARQRLMDAAPIADAHDDLRLAYRLLQKALEGELPRRPDGSEIEIGPDALWFRVGSRPRVDLRRRRALRLILRALVEERLREPGVPISMHRLIAIGWPGEKMRLEAGLSRLYVTVRSLRDLGLRAALLRQDDGYLIDPNVNIRDANTTPSGLNTTPSGLQLRP